MVRKYVRNSYKMFFWVYVKYGPLNRPIKVRALTELTQWNYCTETIVPGCYSAKYFVDFHLCYARWPQTSLSLSKEENRCLCCSRSLYILHTARNPVQTFEEWLFQMAIQQQKG